jgi:response regulator RpfG family c-di-GMP phosphodiesterase
MLYKAQPPQLSGLWLLGPAAGLAAGLCARLLGIGAAGAAAVAALCCAQIAIASAWLAARRAYLLDREELERAIDDLTTEIGERQELHAAGTFALEREILRRSETEDAVRQQLGRMAALRALDATLRGRMDLEVMLTFYLRQMVDLLGAQAAAIYLCDDSGPEMRRAASTGMTEPDLLAFRAGIGEDIVGQVAESWEVCSISDLANADPTPRLLSLLAYGYTDYLAVPLIAHGEILGVLEIANREPLDTSSDAMEFIISAAAQTALALGHASMLTSLQEANEELSDAYDATILALSRALDLRDKETEGHSRRVAELTVSIARSLSISEAEIVAIRRGAILHDIGKLGIPDGILLKPGRLTHDEIAVMRMHPVYAYEMLSPIAFLRPALDIPYCHHERWDGTGYPRGLAGEEIPLAARIFAIVDVWDALRSDRPYHRGRSDEDVRRHLIDGARSHFDPALIEPALSVLFPDIEIRRAA